MGKRKDKAKAAPEPEVVHASDVVAKINTAFAGGKALNLSAAEVVAVVCIVRDAQEQATNSATMLHVFAQRHYGQTSMMVH